MGINNYFTYHLHTELSHLDSCTNYKLYVDKARKLGQKAICFTEHGNVYNWIEKKLYCEKNHIKYVHGVEIYLTKSLTEKVRDNYHTVLIAKNYDGVKEINALVDKSTQEDHFYYKPRISFEEFFKISDNVIKTTACLDSPIYQLKKRLEDLYFMSEEYIEIKNLIDKLLKHYDYYEIQPHINSQEQIEYNWMLFQFSLDGVRFNIQTLSNEQLIILLVKLDSFMQSAKRLKVEDKCKISGYKIAEWIEDIQNKLIILEQREEEKTLKDMEDKLDRLLSQDKKTELEINEIESLIN